MQIWCKFRNKIKKIAAKIASSNVAIWDEFSEQHYHQSIKISISFRAHLALFFNENNVQI